MSEIKSVHDYLSVVNEFAPKDESFYKRAYYRGQRQFKYNVNSSLSRVFSENDLKPNNVAVWNPVTGGTDFYDASRKGFATELFETFKNEHINYPDVNILKKYTLNDLDLMFNAQHYGMATRVIDWTLSPLVALYFATEDKNDEVISDASVFMLWDPNKKLDICTSNDLVDRISSYKAIYSRVWDLIHSFLNDHYFYYKTSGSIDVVREALLELKHKIMQLHRNVVPGRHILLNEKYNYFDLMFPLKGDDEIFLNNCLNFVAEGIQGYNYCLSSIELKNDYNTIVNPVGINQRLKNQQGVFLFSNSIEGDVYPANDIQRNIIVNVMSDINGLVRVNFFKEGFIKIRIPKNSISAIRQELATYGFTKDFIYPELSSYTEQLQKRLLAKRKGSFW